MPKLMFSAVIIDDDDKIIPDSSANFTAVEIKQSRLSAYPSIMIMNNLKFSILNLAQIPLADKLLFEPDVELEVQTGYVQFEGCSVSRTLEQPTSIPLCLRRQIQETNGRISRQTFVESGEY